MNTGKHKIWICLRKRHIFIKLTEKKIENVFAIYRGKGKKKKIKVNKRSKVKRALYVKSLRLMAYMSNLADLVFSEFWISETLYRKLKDEADIVIMDFEREYDKEYDEELMVF